jgi:GTP:adenosylcobinamide-phosphate guanylyltransferase
LAPPAPVLVPPVDLPALSPTMLSIMMSSALSTSQSRAPNSHVEASRGSTLSPFIWSVELLATVHLGKDPIWSAALTSDCAMSEAWSGNIAAWKDARFR